MISALHEFVLAVGSSLPASVVTKATVIAALGLIGARLARRSRAALRHVLLAAMFGVLLLLPAASILTPTVRIAVPAVPQEHAAAHSVAANIDLPLPLAQADTHSATTPALSRSFAPSPSTLLFFAWLIGVALSMIPMIVGLAKIRALRRTGLPWTDGQSLLDRLALESGITRQVELLLHEALPGPIASGMPHPAILLPVDAQSWELDDLHRALVHELEHVRRADVVVHSLARAVCSLYWFHPLVWMAWRQLTLEAERACDDAVIVRSEATAYADQLVGLARRLLTAGKSPVLAMANRSDLAARVNAVLDSRQHRGRAGRFAVGVGCAAVVVLVLTVSPLRTISVLQSAPAQSVVGSSSVSGVGPPLPSFEVASVKPSRPGETIFSEFTWSGFTVRSETAKWLITFAYAASSPKANLSDDQLSGGPGWINSEPYDIQAKVEDSRAEKLRQRTMGEIGLEIRLMVQSLLADRFKLRVHHETKQRPVYALVVARGGPKFLHTRFTLPQPATAKPSGQGGKPLPPETPGMRRYRLRGPVMNLAALLSGFPAIGRQVIDKTGIEGNYVFDFEVPLVQFQPATMNGPDGRISTSGSSPSSESSGASVFTLLQEQLGLKLVPTKGAVDVIVIDHIERPTEN
jgi:uncharacterized protein (TIGR03435 family)